MDELTLVRELRPEAEPMRPEVRRKAQAALRFEIGYARAQAARRRPRRLRAAVAVGAVAFVAGAVAIVDERVDGTRLAGTDRAPALGTGIPRGDQYLYTREILIETPVNPRLKPERFVDEIWRSVSGLAPSRESERGRTWTTVGESWPPHSYEKLAELPTEPGALRDAMLGAGGSGGGEPGPYDDELAYLHLMMLLRNWSVMPPGLRAAAFEAVTQIPGVVLIEGDTDARGRRGIGITRPGYRFGGHVIVDPEHYEYLGFRDTFVRDDGVTVKRVSARVGHGVVDRIGQRPR